MTFKKNLTKKKRINKIRKRRNKDIGAIQLRSI